MNVGLFMALMMMTLCLVDPMEVFRLWADKGLAKTKDVFRPNDA